MPTLRLFAAAREAAGTASVVVPGAPVGAVLDAASVAFGQGFDVVLGSCRVWLNGEATDRSAAVVESDEVAVLPPVSGGCR